tara:strand:- start:64 stop:627 length:564 start_codon:yes stop_codon:yes gene_type:complete
MNNQTLIVYQLPILHQILKEIDHHLNFDLFEIENSQLLKNKIKGLKNFIIITKKSILNLENQIIFNFGPIKISKLIEIINIELLKRNFSNQSNISIKSYIINKNSREMLLKDKKLKLTEKEVDTIIYLSKIRKPVNIEELQKNVWQYQANIETHTVETHIYRLRKKILQKFEDSNFIISKKNGYQID